MPVSSNAHASAPHLGTSRASWSQGAMLQRSERMAVHGSASANDGQGSEYGQGDPVELNLGAKLA